MEFYHYTKKWDELSQGQLFFFFHYQLPGNQEDISLKSDFKGLNYIEMKCEHVKTCGRNKTNNMMES